MKDRGIELFNGHGSIADPPGRGDGGGGTPEAKKGEGAEAPGKDLPQVRRLGIAIGQLSPVGTVYGTGGNAPVRISGHVVPPETVGAGEGRIYGPPHLPDLFPLNEPVRLAPEKNLGQIAKIPAVADDAVLRRQPSRKKGRLHAAGYCRTDRMDPGNAVGKFIDPWRMGSKKGGTEAGNIDDHCPFHSFPPSQANSRAMDSITPPWRNFGGRFS